MARILIVDDDPNSRRILELMLSHLPGDRLLARNGQEAIAMAVSERPDLILMDILMPEMDGIAATRSLRENPETGAIPIIALSALAFPRDRALALTAGCSDYLVKPFSRRELLAIVGRFMPLAADRAANG